MEFQLERELVDAFCMEARLSGYQVHTEVPCFSHNIDIVLKAPSGLVAIECKMSDWRRALCQARRHLLAFDYCYVCMPERRVTEEVKADFQQAGIGLILFCQRQLLPVRLVIPALRSREKMASIGAIIERVIEEESHEYRNDRAAASSC